MLAFGYAAELDPDFEPAREAKLQMLTMKGGTSEVKPEDAKEAQPQQTAENTQNKDMEDLSGGGQEATKKDMERQRQEETVSTNIRKGKELDEAPEDVGSSIQKQDNSNILMRKIDDDPSNFLKRKFKYQVKKENIKPKSNEKTW
jgi:Ca-activated chloride channel family protein